jgi:ABC-type glycerol-3-phosphate transport system substrate-binding protein
MRINLDSKLGLEAFEKTCDFFTQYSFPYTYDAANRFRTGEMPIIISDYTALYNTLKVFATEIDGSWTFMPLPGMKDADGNINNCSVSTVMASVMVNGCQNKEKAWSYMQWYTSAQTQASFANEMVAILGDSAKQPVANKGALELMTWSSDELEEVKRQFNNLAAIPNYPGSYYIDRYTKFAFLEAYNNGANPVTSLQAYIDDINNEITRKREEFKLETLKLNETLASKRLAQAQDALDAIGDAASAHSALVQSTEMAISRSNEKLIRVAIADLQAADATLFAKVIGYLTDAADALATY